VHAAGWQGGRINRRRRRGGRGCRRCGRGLPPGPYRRLAGGGRRRRPARTHSRAGRPRRACSGRCRSRMPRRRGGCKQHRRNIWRPPGRRSLAAAAEPPSVRLRPGSRWRSGSGGGRRVCRVRCGSVALVARRIEMDRSGASLRARVCRHHCGRDVEDGGEGGAAATTRGQGAGRVVVECRVAECS